MGNSFSAAAAYFRGFEEIALEPSAALRVLRVGEVTLADVVGALGRAVTALSALTPPLEAEAGHLRLIQAISDERSLLQNRETALSLATLSLDLASEWRLVEVLHRAGAAFEELVEVASAYGLTVSIPGPEADFGWTR